MEHKYFIHENHADEATPKRGHFTYLNEEAGRGWTASRCQRLLRIITSRIAILRKQTESCSSYIVTGKKSKEISYGSKASQDLLNKKDADWTKKKKKLRRTYGRSIKDTKQCTANSKIHLSTNTKKLQLPGEVTIPTPILTRARGELHIDVNVHPKLCNNKIEPVKKLDYTNSNKLESVKKVCRDEVVCSTNLLAGIRQSFSGTPNSTFNGIYNGLEGLLHATSPTVTQTQRKGTISLMETTLKSIPKYITQQQGKQNNAAHPKDNTVSIDHQIISHEVYNELESYGSHGNGWKWLRNVVRAHGVHIICEATREGLFRSEYCGVLISLCMKMEAIEEGQSILSSHVRSTTYSRPKSTYEVTSKPISLLLNLSQYTSHSSFTYRELSYLISEGILPIEWLVTKEFGPIWIALFHSLAAESGTQHDAFKLFDNSLTLLLNYPARKESYRRTPIKEIGISCANSKLGDAVKNLFTSLLIYLLTAKILELNPDATLRKQDQTQAQDGFDNVISSLMGYLPYNSTDDEVNENYYLLLTSYLIICGNHDQPRLDEQIKNNISKFIAQPNRSSFMCERIAIFICHVARCCGRGTAGLGFDHLQLIHNRLQHFVSSSRDYDFLKDIALESALLFAQEVPGHQHIEYANNMNASHCSGPQNIEIFPTSVKIGAAEKKTNIFRWEEGIGEWVAKTPAVNNLKRNYLEMIDELHYRTPLRTPPRYSETLLNPRSRVIESIFQNSMPETMSKLNVQPSKFQIPAKLPSFQLSTKPVSWPKSPTVNQENQTLPHLSIGKGDVEIATCSDLSSITRPKNVLGNSPESFSYQNKVRFNVNEQLLFKERLFDTPCSSMIKKSLNSPTCLRNHSFQCMHGCLICLEKPLLQKTDEDDNLLRRPYKIFELNKNSIDDKFACTHQANEIKQNHLVQEEEDELSQPPVKFSSRAQVHFDPSHEINKKSIKPKSSAKLASRLKPRSNYNYKNQVSCKARHNTRTNFNINISKKGSTKQNSSKLQNNYGYDESEDELCN
ncbi:unnamed protein product [Blumeria hordei]|uniref:Uncharacterized protein n=1 Tax=Blumeria hordei TaxID=2867405 RepID=A0A383UNI3_BLUHO|nr:unnamed protein product [Blumeria hordei]